MKYTILALLGKTIGNQKLQRPSGLEFLDEREPKGSVVPNEVKISPPSDYSKFSGNVGSQSHLKGQEKENELAKLPYGPYFLKKYEWESERHGTKPLEDTEPNSYQDQAGIWTGTLAQVQSQSAHNHKHRPSRKFDESFVQTSAEGIPVFVNPESTLYPNVIKDYDFNETWRVGLDDLSLVQTSEKGIPILVNPESTLYPNVIKDFSFGETWRVGSDDINLVQTAQKGFPVFVNPESTLYPNVVKDYEFKENWRVGLDDISLIQQKELPGELAKPSVAKDKKTESVDSSKDSSDDSQSSKSNQIDKSLYNTHPAPYCSSSGWCGRTYGAKAPEPKPQPRIGAYDKDGSWILPKNLTNTTGTIVVPGDQDSIPCIKGIDTNVVRCTAGAMTKQDIPASDLGKL